MQRAVSAVLNATLSPAIAAMAVFLFLAGQSHAAALPAGTVKYNGGRFSVRGDNISFLGLIEDISGKADIKIYIVDRTLPSHVSFDFADRTLADTLRMVLRGCSYAVVYGAEAESRELAALQERVAGDQQFVLLEGRDGNSARPEGPGGPGHHFPTEREATAGPDGRPRPDANAVAFAGQAWGDGPGTVPKTAGLSGSGTSRRSNAGAVSLLGAGGTMYSPGETSGQTAAGGSNATGNSGIGSGTAGTGGDSYAGSNDGSGENRRCKNYCAEKYQLEARLASGQSDRDYAKWASIRGAESIQHDRDRLEYLNQQIRSSGCNC